MTDIQRIFLQWPGAIRRVGVIVTAFGDNIPFNDYMVNGKLLLLLRPTPDAHNIRRVIVNMDNIVGLKFEDAIEPERFTAMGFQRPEKCGTAPA